GGREAGAQTALAAARGGAGDRPGGGQGAGQSARGQVDLSGAGPGSRAVGGKQELRSPPRLVAGGPVRRDPYPLTGSAAGRSATTTARRSAWARGSAVAPSPRRSRPREPTPARSHSGSTR